ncbi:rhomboid family intramembrane serine protease [bacterium]|nr:rhomboid family intramembrane serine protease [bacterium]
MNGSSSQTIQVEQIMSLLFGVIVLTIGISWWVQDRPHLKAKLLLRPFDVIHKGQLYRLISHGFIHADFTHLAFNMFVLWQFGSSVEYQMQQAWSGSSLIASLEPSFLVLYFGGMLAAGLPSLWKQRDNPNYASLGASGGVSAVMMAYILLFPTNKLLLFFVIPMPAFVAGILFFAYERYMNKRGATGIAHDAHLMGAIFGVVYVLLLDSDTVPRMIRAFSLLF